MAVQERIGRAGAQPALLLFNCASATWQAGSGGIAVGGAHNAGSTTDHAAQALHDAARAAPRPVPEGGIANDPGPTTDHAVQALHDAAGAAPRPVPEGELQTTRVQPRIMQSRRFMTLLVQRRVRCPKGESQTTRGRPRIMQLRHARPWPVPLALNRYSFPIRSGEPWMQTPRSARSFPDAQGHPAKACVLRGWLKRRILRIRG